MAGQCNRFVAGGLIDREHLLRFRFDGVEHAGHAGDTLASALLANGVRLVGRSFKYHRPRGVLSAGSEEPNALVELHEGARRDPNTRATTVELFDGLSARSQNRFPSLRLDLLELNALLSPVLGAGFYYKTFMWPAAFWEKVYEPFIRHAAGLGSLSGEPDPDGYEKGFTHCDLLVIGAGPCGLMAALVAARAGLRVVLADEDFRAGGRLLAESHEVDGASGADWAAATTAALDAMDNVRRLSRTTVFGVYDGGVYGALERVTDHLASPPAHLPRQRLWKVFARHAILAAGALERHIAFGGNDRPGVMLAGAVRAYLNRHAVAVGREVAVFTNNDYGWRTALDLRRRGVELSAVVDTRAESPALDLDGAPVFRSARIVHTRGRLGLATVDVQDDTGRIHRLRADALAVSGGWNPTVGLTCHQRALPRWDDAVCAFVPDAVPARIRIGGAAAGRFSTAAALADGARLAAAVAADLGRAAAPPSVPAAEDGAYRISAFWRVADSRSSAFVDLQNDVTLADVEQARREGFRSVEHLKRYTTLGMATDQGKTANVTALAVMAELTGRTIPETGTTVYRPPYTPVAIAAFAGRSRGQAFRPRRLTPSHDWADERGAVFVETGAWLRAQWFPLVSERHWRESVDREVVAVRSRVGVCDVTTLGKIDIQGADAAEFLDRVYANTFSTLAVGRVRYGLMLREDGIVMDDGTTARLGERHFLMTTTTANAERVLRHLEFCRQVLWPELDVQLISVTDHWAQFAIAGPRGRDLLARVVDEGYDVSNEALPYMGARLATVCGGCEARLFRLSFSGELGYEVAVPARFGDALMRALMTAGEPLGVVPYGTEALGVLRIEKGHPAGNELNGTTTAADLGLGKLVSEKKDCIGKTLSQRPGLVDPTRPGLAGFRPVDAGEHLAAGAHFVGVGRRASARRDEGYMTSVGYSPTLGTSIGLGLIERSGERRGERIRALDPVRGRDVEVEVVSPHFVDPKGERLRV